MNEIYTYPDSSKAVRTAYSPASMLAMKAPVVASLSIKDMTDVDLVFELLARGYSVSRLPVEDHAEETGK